jgi:N-acetylmuramoyl-L-alanine amidase
VTDYADAARAELQGPAVRSLKHFRRLALTAVLASVTGAAALVTSPSLAGGSVAGVAAGRAIDDKYFEPGSCVEFAPTSGDRRLTVFLDAGHGGIDPGGVGETESGQTIYEEDETLPVELDTAKLLEGKGFTVVVSRTGNQLVGRPRSGDVSDGILTIQGDHDDVATRDVCANDAEADLLLGIYFDAGGSPYNAGSVTGYDSVRPFAAQNLQFATLVQNDVLNAMNAKGWDIPSLGVTNDTELGGPALSTAAADYSHLLLLGPGVPGWFDTPSRMPGALIEPLFITDPFEGSIADSASGQQVIAGGLAQAVEQYFAPPATGKNSEEGGRGKHHTERDSQRRRPAA